ncbi:MAG TPA: LysM peptidoglycan-binding domain-containing protein [Actinomycetota bacterium]|nr:LysM peptidoglycan-binding domain-containing protein [Actinomycetota bacterium]
MHRTYVRRRLVVIVTTIGIMLALGGQAARGLAGDPLEPAVSRTYVVRQGDTLWSIAARLAPDRDPRAVILELERLNESAIDGLVPGRSLSIPPSS